MGTVTQELIEALANATNQAILSLLAVEPAHPRRVAEVLSIGESDASRRLRRLEEAGLVSASWERVDDRNVKAYRLVVEDVSIEILGEGLAIETSSDGEDGEVAVVGRVQPQVPEPEGFVGREPELQRIDRGGPVAVLEGIAGIGKTSLAAAWAQRSQRPVFFHGFSGTESLTWLAHRMGVFRAAHGDRGLLDAVEAGVSLADQRQLLLEAIEDPETACVFDAVERVRDEDVEDVVTEAIERTRDGKLLVVGRTTPAFDPSTEHVERIRLSGLPPEDVARLLEDRGLDPDPETAQRIQRRLGGHPLAVNLFAQTAAEADGPLETALEAVPDQEIETYLLGEIHEQLSDPERRALAYASVFRGPFRTEDLEAVHPGNPRGALVKLRRRRLLDRDGDAYRMHDLLASFFEEQLEEPAAVHAQAAEHALAKGTREARVDALHHLLEAGKRRRVLSLLEKDLDLEEFDLIEEGYHNLYLDVLERLDPDQILDDRRRALLHDELGDIRHHRGEYEQALDHYQAASEGFDRAEARDRLADLAWKQALALRELGREAEAVSLVDAGLGEHAPDERTRERLTELADELEDAG